MTKQGNIICDNCGSDDVFAPDPMHPENGICGNCSTKVIMIKTVMEKVPDMDATKCLLCKKKEATDDVLLDNISVKVCTRCANDINDEENE